MQNKTSEKRPPDHHQLEDKHFLEFHASFADDDNALCSLHIENKSDSCDATQICIALLWPFVKASRRIIHWEINKLLFKSSQ